jgi:hypothetical protein
VPDNLLAPTWPITEIQWEACHCGMKSLKDWVKPKEQKDLFDTLKRGTSRHDSGLVGLRDRK